MQFKLIFAIVSIAVAAPRPDERPNRQSLAVDTFDDGGRASFANAEGKLSKSTRDAALQGAAKLSTSASSAVNAVNPNSSASRKTIQAAEAVVPNQFSGIYTGPSAPQLPHLQKPKAAKGATAASRPIGRKINE